MKNSILAAMTMFAMAANFVAPTFADNNVKGSGLRRSAELVALLPASDAVVTMDSGRFLSDALPRLLSGNQPLLAKMTASINEMQSKTGIDIRQFNNVAAGLLIK